jgi:hypothetical protein
MSTADTPFKLGVPVPSLLWGTFEDALRLNVRRLAKDIATTLGQPEQPLLDALFKSPAGACRPYLIEEFGADEKETTLACCFPCQRPDAPKFLSPCGQPILWMATTDPSQARCPQHLYATLPAAAAALPMLTPLEEVEGEQLWRDEAGTLYDKEFRPRGTMNLESKRVIRLCIEEEEAK